MRGSGTGGAAPGFGAPVVAADPDSAMRALRGGDAWARRQAAEILADLPGDRVSGALVEALGDPVYEVRRAAAGGLAERLDASLIPGLLGAVRRGSAGASDCAVPLLARLALGHPGPFLELSRDPDPRLRLVAVGMLAEASAATAVPRLLELLSDPDFNVQDAAIASLGAHRAAAALPGLAALLQSDNPWLTFSVIFALGRIGGPEALAALATLLSTRDPDVRVLAVDALGAAACATLAEALAGAGDPGSSLRAVQAVHGAVHSVKRALKDAAWLRPVAVQAVDAVAGAGLSAEVLVELVRLLGTLAVPETRPVLLAAARHADPRIAEAAREVLKELSEGGAP